MAKNPNLPLAGPSNHPGPGPSANKKEEPQKPKRKGRPKDWVQKPNAADGLFKKLGPPFRYHDGRRPEPEKAEFKFGIMEDSRSGGNFEELPKNSRYKVRWDSDPKNPPNEVEKPKRR
jgi:hypothetical protein